MTADFVQTETQVYPARRVNEAMNRIGASVSCRAEVKVASSCGVAHLIGQGVGDFGHVDDDRLN